MKVWGFDRRQLIASVVGVILYAILARVSNYPASPVVGDVLAGAVWAVPLFLGSVFGPWVSLGAAGVGSLVYHSLVGDLSTSWYLPVGIALTGFVAGLTMLKSQGRYDNRRNIIFATVVVEPH